MDSGERMAADSRFESILCHHKSSLPLLEAGGFGSEKSGDAFDLENRSFLGVLKKEICPDT